MAPVIRECQRRGLDFFIIHSGQHYSYEMDRVFFDQLDLPPAQYNLEIGSGHHGEQTAKAMVGVERILFSEKPDVLLIQGDTNTTLAAALAAAKINLKIGHVEAGLRSGDRNMPEEINRTLTDHVSDYLFAPTGISRRNLLREGIPGSKIFVTGNTIVDALGFMMDSIGNESDSADRLALSAAGYFLATVHREENVDTKQRLQNILDGLEMVHNKFGLPIVLPLHPRTGKRINELGLRTPAGIRFIAPVGLVEFLQLEKNARLILTDSGGVQEEACVLRVPCVTLRDNTERPETVDVGANMIAGTSPRKIVECAQMMLGQKRDWENPLGDGNAGNRIVTILQQEEGNR